MSATDVEKGEPKASPMRRGWKTGFCENGDATHDRCPVTVYRPAPNEPAVCTCPRHAAEAQR